MHAPLKQGLFLQSSISETKHWEKLKSLFIGVGIKRLLPNVRIYAYAFKKRVSVNSDARIYAG